MRMAVVKANSQKLVNGVTVVLTIKGQWGTTMKMQAAKVLLAIGEQWGVKVKMQAAKVLLAIGEQ
jgi:predicted nucleic acid-binding Zn ribbon protein